MTVTTLVPQVTRIPNLPTGPMIEKDGYPTDDEQTFRQILVSSLQNNFGNEGCVVPTQSNAAAPNDYITQIQDNQLPNGEYTCGFGRFLYDETNNRVLVSIDDGTGKPIFKTVVLI